jgi:biopolymer transport protein ExbD
MSIQDTITLRRPTPPKAVISLVPMIDVMLILLVFFMVTSTYLNLDMIPAVSQSDSPSEASNPGRSEGSAPLLIRLGADGVPAVQGRGQSRTSLSALITSRIQQDPLTQVILLPSGAAHMQSLVSVMDLATTAGAVRMRVIRLEAKP